MAWWRLPNPLAMPPGMPSIMRRASVPDRVHLQPGPGDRSPRGLDAVAEHLYRRAQAREDPDPTFQGESIGRWEGHAGRRNDCDQAEPGAYVCHARGPVPAHGPKLRITERSTSIRRTPTSCTDEITLEDPDALAEPYTQTITCRRRARPAASRVRVCENDRNPVDADGNTTFKHD